MVVQVRLIPVFGVGHQEFLDRYMMTSGNVRTFAALDRNGFDLSWVPEAGRLREFPYRVTI